MCEEMTPLRSWEFFHSCKMVLGEKFFTKLYRRDKRQIYRWSSDPRFTDGSERNPIDRFNLILERLRERGREDLVVSALRIMAAPFYEIVKLADSVVPDKETIADECLDDYPALTAFHDAIRKGAPVVEVNHFLHEAITELRETYSLYCEQGIDG